MTLRSRQPGARVLLVGVGLFLVCAGPRQVRAADPAPPSNRHDTFLFGHYGGIAKGEWLQNIPIEQLTCYEIDRNYGVDWAWVQGPRAMPDEPFREAIVELKDQVRIFFRLTWWRDKRFDPKYFQDGAKGPDWIDLADDPAALETVLQIIGESISSLLDECGEDALYGVTLSEEQPTSIMYNSPKRDMHWFKAHRKEACEKIIFVVNEMYRYIKERHPQIRVAHSFYPGVVLDPDKKMLYDDIVMTCFPSEGYSPERLQRKLNDWREAFPPAPNVYVLLRCDLGVADPRAEVIDRTETIFQAFLEAGYRNIGWFGLAKQSTAHDYILELAESLSPGTSLGDAANLDRYLAIETEKRAAQDEVFRRLFPYIPADIQPIARQGRTTLAEARAAYDAGEAETARRLLAEARSHYHRAVNAALNHADAYKRKLALSLAMDELIKLLVLPVDPVPELRNLTTRYNDFYPLTTFATLPEALAGVFPRLEKVNEKRRVVIGALEEKRAGVNARGELGRDLDARTAAAVDALLLEDAACIKAVARELADLYAVADPRAVLEIVWFSPYDQILNLRPRVRVSADGEVWQDVPVSGRAFTKEDAAEDTLRVPVDAVPAFVWVEPGPGGWHADIGIRGVSIVEPAGWSRLTEMVGSGGDVALVRRGETAALDVGHGTMKDFTMTEDTIIVRCRQRHQDGDYEHVIMEVAGSE